MITKVYHADHGIEGETMTWLKAQLENETEFFIKVLELPAALPSVVCGLYGPSEGDAAVDEADVHYIVRNNRPCASRMVNKPARPARFIVAIGAGETLFTAYGSLKGSVSEREPGDPSLPDWETVCKAREFWKGHALCA